MLAKNALGLRRALPLGRRCMSSVLADLDKLTESSTKMAATLPEVLKPLATDFTGVAADIKAKYAADPELYKLMEAKIAEADKPGVRATVAAPKAPHSCKYTEEGTLAYYLMQHIAKVDRRMVALSEIEVTLTGADKAKWAEDAKAYYLKELEEANASLPEGDKVKPDLSGLPAAPASFKIA